MLIDFNKLDISHGLCAGFIFFSRMEQGTLKFYKNIVKIYYTGFN